MDLQKIIYSAITSSTGCTSFTGLRVYHKHLPNDFKINNITTVFIINKSLSEGSFDDSNEIEVYNVSIKLNYINSAILYDYQEEIKKAIFAINNEKIKYIEYNNSDLIWNPNFDFFNLNTDFTIQYEN